MTHSSRNIGNILLNTIIIQQWQQTIEHYNMLQQWQQIALIIHESLKRFSSGIEFLTLFCPLNTKSVLVISAEY